MFVLFNDARFLLESWKGLKLFDIMDNKLRLALFHFPHLQWFGGNKVIDALGLHMLVKNFLVVYNLIVYLDFFVTP